MKGDRGIYSYYFWYLPKEQGEIYIRAFEVTREDELSESRLYERSKISVEPSDTLQLFTKDFTIYEGNWHQYYGARIEVWFRPKNGEKERKLTEEFYIIDGWMR